MRCEVSLLLSLPPHEQWRALKLFFFFLNEACRGRDELECLGELSMIFGENIRSHSDIQFLSSCCKGLVAVAKK